MSRKQTPVIIYKGRSLGIVVLTAAQLIIGAIHTFFGLLLLGFENLSFIPATVVYNLYTFVFGLLTRVFAVFIWQGKKSGWVGTIAISLFVIVVDSLTLLDLPSDPWDTEVCRVYRNCVQCFDNNLLVHQPSQEEIFGLNYLRVASLG